VELRQIKVGGRKVGVVGLEDAFARVAAMGPAESSAIADRLVEAVGQLNYIPPQAVEVYREGLLREYRVWAGAAAPETSGELEISVFGPGCPRCHELEASVLQALAELELAADVQRVTDPVAIARHGVFSTPALLVNGRLVVAGRVPSRREVVTLLGEALERREGGGA